jgi:hypothetical protein
MKKSLRVGRLGTPCQCKVKAVLGDNYEIAATNLLLSDTVAVTAAVLLSLFFLVTAAFPLPLIAGAGVLKLGSGETKIDTDWLR